MLPGFRPDPPQRRVGAFSFLRVFMRLEELEFDLPSRLIAAHPCEPRDGSRLLHVERGGGRIAHARFRDLGALLRPGDLLVVNTARVTAARVRARQKPEGTPVELLVLDAGTGRVCRALAGSRRPLKAGARLRSEGGAAILVEARRSDGSWGVLLEEREGGWIGLLAREGRMPLPPYILKKRAERSDAPEDRARYQTVFADREGAVAAPTAGLHFSEGMLTELAERGIGIARLFLRVGPGTFLPVRSARVEEHRLMAEEFEIGADCAEMVRKARASGGRVVAVGTTVVRALEHCARERGEVTPCSGATDLLICPPFSFRVVDGLLTNFHLPRSTLLALVYALGGAARVRAAYVEAVREGYRFYSYGDAMLLL